MLNIKQKSDEQKEGGDITQLDGSPAPDAVSKVAMGEEPETDDEHRDEYQEEAVARLMGQKKAHPDLCSIEDAYAMLFEGLAGIMKHKS